LPVPPEELCGLFRDIGVDAGVWHQGQSGDEWLCISAYVKVGAKHPVAGISATVEYQVSGSRAGAAREVFIRATYYKILPKEPPMQKLRQMVERALDAFGDEQPEEIIAAIQGEKNTTFERAYGNVEVESDCGPPLPPNNQACWVAFRVFASQEDIRK